MCSGSCSNLWSSPRRHANGGDVHGGTRGKSWRACYGFCAPERNGRSCPRTSFRRTKPAIAASSAGCGKARWSRSCGHWPRICWRAGNWICPRPSSTLPSAVRKRGRCSWSNTPRQRDQDHGNRGPPWFSCRRGDCKRFTTALPQCLIGDRAYDSDPLDARLQQQHGIELVAPHKSNRSRPKTQDGRRLRRYCRRWKIERLFAWLHNFRRLVTRWEYYEANFLGLVQLGCILILMRNYL